MADRGEVRIWNIWISNSSKQLAKIYDTGYFLKYVLTHVKWLWYGATIASGHPSNLLALLPTQHTRPSTNSTTVKRQKEIRGGSHKRSPNILEFPKSIFIILISMSKEKPKQLTTPEIEVCHKHRKRSVMIPKR